MKRILLLLFVFGSCGGTNDRHVNKKYPHMPDGYDKGNGVFQNVVYNNMGGEGKYYLDTWAQTNQNQWHNHWVMEKGSGMYSIGGGLTTSGQNTSYTPNYPYDSLCSGSFEYIKSVKAAEYKRAKAVYDYEIKIGIEQRRVEDSTKKAVAMRIDSVKMLNDLH